MKKVGFIDYYLNEWHAVHYPAWIAASGERAGTEICVAYAWGEIDAPDGTTNKEWCSARNIELLDSIEDVCRRSDYIIILSPDNSEKHLDYVRRAAPFGKPIFVDKTFAPDLATAREIFRLSEEYGTPLFSTSSLRYAEEILPFHGDARQIVTTGKGPDLATYAVHQLEMVIKILGTDVESVTALISGPVTSLHYQFSDGKNAVVNFGFKTRMPYSVCVETAPGESYYAEIVSEFFPRFIDALVSSYDSGVLPVAKEETLAVIACIEAAEKAVENPGVRIDI